jgi:4-deoxy-L-threo-5-hexosulose-uronate ketol-isomerase
MSTSELRENFLVKLFKSDKINLVYSNVDRAIVGSAVPVTKTLKLEASKKEMAAEYFAQRREIGIMNIGAAGTVDVDNKKYELEHKSCLYIGRGSKDIQFSSIQHSNPAKFYIVSYPAHQTFPTAKADAKDAKPVKLGSIKESNQRTIYKYIFSDGIKSAQLVMGFTELDEGSVWNTMSAHTHLRRSEIYLYFNLPEDGLVCHLMGEPDETRHVIVRNGEAVISPSWSIHSGAGTTNYTFIWSMGGENQEFDDMDWIDKSELA